MEQFILDHLPQGVILFEEEQVSAFNPKAKAFLPFLALGDRLEEIFPEELEEEGEIFRILENLRYSCTRAGGKVMITLEPLDPPGLSGSQVEGVFYALREQLGQIQVQLPQLTGEEGPRSALYQSLTQLQRLVDHGELLQEKLVLPLMPLDLAGLCRELCREVAPMLARMDLKLTARDIPASLMISGNSQYLRKVILGLLANYAREGGGIALSLVQQKNTALLQLKSRDPGPLKQAVGDVLAGKHGSYIPAPGQGAGLGFPLISRIVTSLGGTLLAKEGAEGGLEISLAFPVATKQVLQFFSPAGRPEFAMDRSGGVSDLLLELSPVLDRDFFKPEEMEE